MRRVSVDAIIIFRNNYGHFLAAKVTKEDSKKSWQRKVLSGIWVQSNNMKSKVCKDKIISILEMKRWMMYNGGKSREIEIKSRWKVECVSFLFNGRFTV